MATPFTTSNTCPSCGTRWTDATPTPGVLHRTCLCATCAPPAPPLPRLPVKSSNLTSLGYADGLLDVEFKHGGCYRYFDVPAAVHATLLAAPSIGSAFAALIRAGGFKYVVLPVEDAAAATVSEVA